MSESELYMQDSNESYDLPRWQTQVDPLSSSAQAPHATQSPYLYPGPPPPPPQSSSQRIQPVYQGTVPPTKQPRISQLVEQEQQFGASLSPYSSGGQSQLSRSTSLGASAGSTFAATRLRRHPQDDLEGALNSDNHAIASSRQQQPLPNNYFYSPSVGYPPQSLSGGGPNASNEAYTDIYYNGSSSNPPKRLQTGQQESNANRGGRSPLRIPNTPISASPLDYSQQTQYSPTTTSSYSYGVDQRPHPPPFQTHNRSHSQVKTENATPPLSTSYPSQPSSNTYPSGNYSTPYAMETSSPHPSIQPHLSTKTISMKSSLSTPSTPLSYGAGSVTLSPNSSLGSAVTHGPHYYPHDQPMVVDSPPKRRPVGFRHVRTLHDLQPKLDAPPAARRMAQDGTYLSVCFLTFLCHIRTYLNAPS